MYVFVNVIEPKCGFLHLAACFFFFVEQLIIHFPSAPGHPSLFCTLSFMDFVTLSDKDKLRLFFSGAGAHLFNAVLNSDK